MRARFLSFGVFEVDLESGELRKRGRLIHLQQQPLLVLRRLLDEPQHLVSRESLCAELWPEGVTVDFDQCLNKSITRLRAALGDSADNPRFIETLPKRGYRFIAPVRTSDNVAPPHPGTLAPPHPGTAPRHPGTEAPGHPASLWSAATLIPILVLSLLIGLLLYATRPAAL